MRYLKLLIVLGVGLPLSACALAPADVADRTCEIQEPPPEASLAKIGYQTFGRQYPPSTAISDFFTGCVTYWTSSKSSQLFQRLMYRDGRLIKRLLYQQNSRQIEVCAYDVSGKEIRTQMRPNEMCPAAALFSLDRVKSDTLDRDLPVEKAPNRVPGRVVESKPQVKRFPINHETCDLGRPPADSVPFRITPSSLLIQFPDPRTLPNNFTGCLTRWHPSGEEWGQSRYVEGRIVQVIIANSACNYKDDRVVDSGHPDGLQILCPPASLQSIERVRSVEEQRLR